MKKQALKHCSKHRQNNARPYLLIMNQLWFVALRNEQAGLIWYVT